MKLYEIIIIRHFIFRRNCCCAVENLKRRGVQQYYFPFLSPQLPSLLEILNDICQDKNANNLPKRDEVEKREGTSG